MSLRKKVKTFLSHVNNSPKGDLSRGQVDRIVYGHFFSLLPQPYLPSCSELMNKMAMVGRMEVLHGLPFTTTEWPFLPAGETHTESLIWHHSPG